MAGFKTIEKEGIEVSLEYCSNGPIGVSSPMSKTMPKQGIEEKWGDQYNVSKTIVKKGGILRQWSNDYLEFIF